MSVLSKFLSKLTKNAIPEVDITSIPIMEYVISGEIDKLLRTLSDKDINKLISVLLREARRRKQGE
jgi:uncharacterized protein YjgD (DUF1641 family)